MAGSKKYDVNAIFKRAVKLLEEGDIIFENQLYDCLGVSKDYFYESLMKIPEYSDSVKSKIFENRGEQSRQAFKDARASDKPACIIARMKCTNAGMRDALTDKAEETESKNVTVNIGGEANVTLDGNQIQEGTK